MQFGDFTVDETCTEADRVSKIASSPAPSVVLSNPELDLASLSTSSAAMGSNMGFDMTSPTFSAAVRFNLGHYISTSPIYSATRGTIPARYRVLEWKPYPKDIDYMDETFIPLLTDVCDHASVTTAPISKRSLNPRAGEFISRANNYSGGDAPRYEAELMSGLYTIIPAVEVPLPLGISHHDTVQTDWQNQNSLQHSPVSPSIPQQAQTRCQELAVVTASSQDNSHRQLPLHDPLWSNILQKAHAKDYEVPVVAAPSGVPPLHDTLWSDITHLAETESRETPVATASHQQSPVPDPISTSFQVSSQDAIEVLLPTTPEKIHQPEPRRIDLAAVEANLHRLSDRLTVLQAKLEPKPEDNWPRWETRRMDRPLIEKIIELDPTFFRRAVHRFTRNEMRSILTKLQEKASSQAKQASINPTPLAAEPHGPLSKQDIASQSKLRLSAADYDSVVKRGKDYAVLVETILQLDPGFFEKHKLDMAKRQLHHHIPLLRDSAERQKLEDAIIKLDPTFLQKQKEKLSQRQLRKHIAQLRQRAAMQTTEAGINLQSSSTEPKWQILKRETEVSTATLKISDSAQSSTTVDQSQASTTESEADSSISAPPEMDDMESFPILSVVKDKGNSGWPVLKPKTEDAIATPKVTDSIPSYATVVHRPASLSIAESQADSLTSMPPDMDDMESFPILSAVYDKSNYYACLRGGATDYDDISYDLQNAGLDITEGVERDDLANALFSYVNVAGMISGPDLNRCVLRLALRDRYRRSLASEGTSGVDQLGRAHVIPFRGRPGGYRHGSVHEIDVDDNADEGLHVVHHVPIPSIVVTPPPWQPMPRYESQIIPRPNRLSVPLSIDQYAENFSRALRRRNGPFGEHVLDELVRDLLQRISQLDEFRPGSSRAGRFRGITDSGQEVNIEHFLLNGLESGFDVDNDNFLELEPVPPYTRRPGPDEIQMAQSRLNRRLYGAEARDGGIASVFQRHLASLESDGSQQVDGSADAAPRTLQPGNFYYSATSINRTNGSNSRIGRWNGIASERTSTSMRDANVFRNRSTPRTHPQCDPRLEPYFPVSSNTPSAQNGSRLPRATNDPPPAYSSLTNNRSFGTRGRVSNATLPPSNSRCGSFQGGCLCGNIKYIGHQLLGALQACYCLICQRQTGTTHMVWIGIWGKELTLYSRAKTGEPVSANAVVASDPDGSDRRFYNPGDSAVTWKKYREDACIRRGHCAECGTTVFRRHGSPELRPDHDYYPNYYIAAGTIDQSTVRGFEFPRRVARHYYFEERAVPWDERRAMRTLCEEILALRRQVETLQAAQASPPAPARSQAARTVESERERFAAGIPSARRLQSRSAPLVSQAPSLAPTRLLARTVASERERLGLPPRNPSNVDSQPRTATQIEEWRTAVYEANGESALNGEDERSSQASNDFETVNHDML